MVFFIVMGEILSKGINMPWEKGEVQGTGKEVWQQGWGEGRTESGVKVTLLGR